MQLRHSLAGAVGTGTAAPACSVKHRPVVHEKLNQSQATAPPRSALPPTCSGISTSTGFLPLPQYCSLKIISGFASSSGVLCSLASSQGLNILFLFAFLTAHRLPQASRKLSDENQAFPPVACRLEPWLSRYSRFSCKQTSRHPTSLLFRSTEEEERLKIWLSHPLHS